MTFNEFKNEFMPHFNGYVPVYSYYCADYLEKEKFHMIVELISPDRIGDGMRYYRCFRFSVTREQTAEIADYVKRGGEWWQEHLATHSREMIELYDRVND